MQRVGGMIQVKIDGVVMDATGDWTCDLGKPKRDPVIGTDRVHGYKEAPRSAFIEGTITDRGTLDVGALATITNATITVELGSNKTFVLREATFTGEASLTTEEGQIPVRFDGIGAEEIAP